MVLKKYVIFMILILMNIYVCLGKWI